MSVGNTNLKTEFPLFDANEEGQKLQISIDPISISTYTRLQQLTARLDLNLTFQKSLKIKYDIHFTDSLFHVKEKGKAGQFFG